jgi:hypothetical protein
MVVCVTQNKVLSLFPITPGSSQKSGAKIVIFFLLCKVYRALSFRSSTGMLINRPMGLSPL